jgi:hypothetical protein
MALYGAETLMLRAADQKLPSKTGYRRKDKGRAGSDKKTRKKT